MACGSEKYRDFQSKLVPNIPKETILGVKTPDMRKIAKDIKGTKEAETFLAQLPHRYFEENLVHFFLIAAIRDFDECVKSVETFLPYVDCWPVCDQASPKVFAKNHKKLLPSKQSIRPRRKNIQPSFSASSFWTVCGLALPRLAFIT